MKVIILGAGLVGGPMAIDLQKDKEFKITIADINKERLDFLAGNTGIKTIQHDLADKAALKKLVSGYDLVLSAVPGFMGFETLKTLIEAGKDVIDIAFFPEDLLELDELAKSKNVRVISDIGVAPGMSNILSAYAVSQLDKAESIKIYVGGLPKKRSLPWEYKAVFSPIDVIEEYTRPARFVENDKIITKEPLTDPEFLEFDQVGTLEAFNSDGLRSLIKTIDCPNMIEKTLRYPGHIDKIKVLKESGFFDEKDILIQGNKIRPIDFTTSVLFPKWKLEPGESDLTVMKIIVSGIKNDRAQTIQYDLYDEYDPESGIHSMARTTGYTATTALRMMAKGLYTRKGVSAPEFIGEDKDCVDFMLARLKERGIFYQKKQHIS